MRSSELREREDYETIFDLEGHRYARIRGFLKIIQEQRKQPGFGEDGENALDKRLETGSQLVCLQGFDRNINRDIEERKDILQFRDTFVQ